ncbi:MAG: universal stress protein [SAR324 cluster bacterium]|nr:universal stress protein [SAR324 cluster bacterium]
MFKKILFATTGTSDCDDAASYAFDMAMKYNAKLFVFHVFGTPSHGYSQFVINVKTGEKEAYSEKYDTVVNDEISLTYADLLAQYANVEVKSTIGSAEKEILRKVKTEGVDLIIMGAHKQIIDTEALRYRNVTGDTMQKVAKSAHCPVLIISRPYGKNLWDLKNILFGTDLTKSSMPAFRFSLKFAVENRCTLHLFHSVDITTQFGKIPSQIEIEQKIEEAKVKMRDVYVPEMGGYEKFAIAVWEGIPYLEILKYAREKDIDLIAMAHHTGSIFKAKEVLGSTIEEVVLRSACPVACVNRKDVLDGYEAFQA